VARSVPRRRHRISRLIDSFVVGTRMSHVKTMDE
jgi:hypothetical protein